MRGNKITTSFRLAFAVGCALSSASCSSAFFKVTPNGENAAALPDTTASTRSQGPPKPEPRKPEPRKPEPRKPEPVARVLRPIDSVSSAPPARARPTPPDPGVTARASETTLPSVAEPEPAASDSAGVVHLTHLSTLWQTVRLFHPAVSESPDSWDGAVARTLPALRVARESAALSGVLSTLLETLRDPLTRVEQPATSSEPRRIHMPAEFEVTDDSSVVLTLPANDQYLPEDSMVLRRAAARGNGALIIDLREPALSPASSTGLTAADRSRGSRFVREMNAFIEATGFVESVISAPLMLPGERLRRAGVPLSLPPMFFNASGSPNRNDNSNARTNVDAVDNSVSLVSQHDYLQPRLSGDETARDNRRIAIMANEASIIPRSLAALVLAGRASLVAEAGVSELSLVSSVSVPLAQGVWARVRTSTLTYGGVSVALRADSIVALSDSRGGGASALRVAMTILRSKGGPESPLADQPSTPVYPAGTVAFAIDSTPYPNMGARLIAGFKLWNAMRTQHAHRDSYDDDIDAVFVRAVPRLEAAGNRSEYARALEDMVASFDDGQVSLVGASRDALFGVAAAPFRARLVEGRVIVTDLRPGTPTGVPPVGVEITSADGFPIAAWFADHRRDISASNDWARSRELLRLAARGPEGPALFKIRDVTGPERSFDVVRTALPGGGEEEWFERRSATPSRSGGGLAYVDLERLNDRTADSVFRSVKNARGVVLDLRSALNVSPETVLRHFSSTPQFVAARVVRRGMSAPCLEPTLREAQRSCVDERATIPVSINTDTTDHYKGRIVLLIDDRTQGETEQLALALEASSNAVFIGSSSAGAAAAPVALKLPGGLTLNFPVDEVRRADGGQVHRVGLTPLVEVHPTVRGTRAGTDEVLQRAQSWLQSALDGSRTRR